MITQTPNKLPEDIIGDPPAPPDRKKKEPTLPEDPAKRHIDYERRKKDIQPPPDSPIPDGPETSYELD